MAEEEKGRDPGRSVCLFPGESSKLSPEGGMGGKVRGAVNRRACGQRRIQAVVLDPKGLDGMV